MMKLTIKILGFATFLQADNVDSLLPHLYVTTRQARKRNDRIVYDISQEPLFTRIDDKTVQIGLGILKFISAPIKSIYGNDIEITGLERVPKGLDFTGVEIDHLYEFQLECLQCLKYCRNGLIQAPTGCVDADTEFLTPTGWKRIADYKEGDQVMQYNPNGTAQFTLPLEYVKLPCDELWHIKTELGLDMCLSDEHTVLFKNGGACKKKSCLRTLSFKEVREQLKRGFNGRILSTFKPLTETPYTYSNSGFRLLTILILNGVEDDGGRISVKPPNWRANDRLKHILEMFSVVYEVKKKGYSYVYLLNIDPDVGDFDGSFYQCSLEQLSAILHEAFIWNRYKNVKAISVKSKVSADFFQYIMTIKGFGAYIHKDEKTNKYIVGYRRAPTFSLCNSFHKPAPITPYKTNDGFKYCFSVPSGYLVLRRGDCIFISGNSGKSEIFIVVAQALAKQGPILIFVPNTTVEGTIIRRFKKYDVECLSYRKVRKAKKIEDNKIVISTPKIIFNDIQKGQNLDIIHKFKFVISDECHHNSCWTINQTLLNLPQLERSFGFSATPLQRNMKFDKTQLISDAFLEDALTIAVSGPIVFKKEFKDIRDYINIPHIINYSMSNEEECKSNNWVELRKHLYLGSRLQVVGSVIRKLDDYKLTSITFINNREAGLTTLKSSPVNTACWFGDGDLYVHDGMDIILSKEFKKVKVSKREEYIENLVETGDVRHLIATLHADEGLNLPGLNVALLVEGKSERKVLQRVGRVLRKSDRNSLIINFIDQDISILRGQGISRARLLKKQFGEEVKNCETINELDKYLKEI
jgi:superfamily II DNA or RNA helicase